MLVLSLKIMTYLTSKLAPRGSVRLNAQEERPEKHAI
jgi:hypothetical protein